MGKENIWRNNGHIFFKFDEMYTFTDPETQWTSNKINLKKTVPMHIIF